MSTELKEATLEALRVCLLAVIPVAIDSLSAGSLNLRALLIVALIALLRFFDKYLHQVGKAEGNESLTKGLTRF